MRDESLFFLYSSVTRIKGVGGATAMALQKLLPSATVLEGSAMPTIRDLLFHLPISIVDRRYTFPLSQLPKEPVVATFVVTVDEHQPPPVKRGSKRPYRVLCSNDSGELTLVFFHPREDYIKGALPEGAKRVVSGRVESFDYHLQMTHPDIIAPIDKLAEVQRPEAVYPLTLGLTSRRIGKIVSDAIAKLPELPEWLDEKDKWPRWKTALQLVHHPQTYEDLQPETLPRQRLAYDEILANQLYLAMLRRSMQQQVGAVITGNGKLTDALLKSLPFTLTKGQQLVLSDIHADMASGRRMGRLLQGDVGSGKTVVAVLAMLCTAEQGLQSALMAPTELIAQQHYEVISKMLSSLNINVALLTGSVKGKTREKVLAEIASGNAPIVIGTHALFQEHVVFKNLALVVVDEQHRFGVGQRMALTAKGESPHVLHMTATPIPRSLTMTLYGDMDCSLLTEKPAGRQPIATRAIPLSRYDEVMERLKAALARGEKAYWICPLIEDMSEMGDADIAAAKSRFTEFKARFGNKVGLVHGRMKGEARDEEMRKFASGETKLLVATTVVEVGVDVRDATIMVIEQAERFGLAQLHQLRGRVGRGEKASACVLLYNEGIGDSGLGLREENINPQSPIPNPSLSRLSILRETEDGFRIAEEDLRIRGGGDLLGQRQSGLPRFIFTDIAFHQKLILQAREEAGRVLTNDPQLTGPRGKSLRVLLQLFGLEPPASGEGAEQIGGRRIGKVVAADAGEIR